VHLFQDDEWWKYGAADWKYDDRKVHALFDALSRIGDDIAIMRAARAYPISRWDAARNWSECAATNMTRWASVGGIVGLALTVRAAIRYRRQIGEW
jgi:hypothetical protein